MEQKLRNSLELKPEVELDISKRMTRTKAKIEQKQDGTFRVAVSDAVFDMHGPHHQPFKDTVEQLEQMLDNMERKGFDLRK